VLHPRNCSDDLPASVSEHPDPDFGARQLLLNDERSARSDSTKLFQRRNEAGLPVDARMTALNNDRPFPILGDR
jgi:hypothetical protein